MREVGLRLRRDGAGAAYATGSTAAAASPNPSPTPSPAESRRLRVRVRSIRLRSLRSKSSMVMRDGPDSCCKRWRERAWASRTSFRMRSRSRSHGDSGESDSESERSMSKFLSVSVSRPPPTSSKSLLLRMALRSLVHSMCVVSGTTRRYGGSIECKISNERINRQAEGRGGWWWWGGVLILVLDCSMFLDPSISTRPSGAIRLSLVFRPRSKYRYTKVV